MSESDLSRRRGSSFEGPPFNNIATAFGSALWNHSVNIVHVVFPTCSIIVHFFSLFCRNTGGDYQYLNSCRICSDQPKLKMYTTCFLNLYSFVNPCTFFLASPKYINNERVHGMGH